MGALLSSFIGEERKNKGKKLNDDVVEVIDPSDLDDENKDEEDENEIWDLQDEYANLESRRMCTRYGDCEEYLESFCSLLSKKDEQDMRNFLNFAKQHGILQPDSSFDELATLCDTFLATDADQE